MLRTILILTVISLTTGVFASNPEIKVTDNVSAGHIKGVIKSLNTQNVLPLAQVVVYGEDSEVIRVTTTDRKGNFVISDLPEGTYFLNISYLGYKTLIVDNIIVNAKKTPTIVKKILLERAAYNIGEVMVKAERKDNHLLSATNN